MLKTLVIVGLVSLATATRTLLPFQIQANNLAQAESDKTYYAKYTVKQSKHINKNLVDDIKNKTRDWVPFEPEENPLGALTDEQLAGLAGTVIEPPQTGAFELPEPSGALPTSFDARTQWGNCIHPVMNQANCGSCWAFSASEALSDRFCIKTNKTVNVVLSPQNMVSCDNY